MQTWSRRHEQILGRPQIVCKTVDSRPIRTWIAGKGKHDDD